MHTIEHLDGIYETVNFHNHMGIRVNDLSNSECYPEHWHTPLEIICPIQNGYRIVSGDSVWNLEEGDIAFLRPGTIHTLYAPAVGHQVTYLADLSFAKGIPHMETLLSLLPPVLIISPHSAPEAYPKISALLAEIAAEDAAPQPFYETISYGKLLQILGLLGQLEPVWAPAAAVGTAPSPHSERLLFICSYINEHCTENLTLDMAAQLAGFSKFHFTRVFKEFTKVSFTRYLNQKRISHAESMLVNPEYSITQIALQSGFSSPSVFNRLFKQYKGCSPTQFRKIYSLDGVNRSGV